MNNNMKGLISLYLQEEREQSELFPIDQVACFAEQVWATYLNGGRVFAFGNGGNVGFISDMMTDFSMHPFVSDDKGEALPPEVPRLKAISLCESVATVTAIGNDLGFDHIFRQQLVNMEVNEKDFVIGITGSGTSKNVIAAIEFAKSKGATSAAITGARKNGGTANGLVEHLVIIPGSSSYPGQTGGNDNNLHFETAISRITGMTVGMVKQRVWEKYGNA